MTRIEEILEQVGEAVEKAQNKHAPMASFHEGYAVTLEELDELWEEIKKYPRHNIHALMTEAYHVAAMAVRFIHDLL